VIATLRGYYRRHAVVAVDELADGAIKTRDGKQFVRFLKAHGDLILWSRKDGASAGGWYKHVKGVTMSDMEAVVAKCVAEYEANDTNSETFWD
jgi:hypothetical protein